MSSLDKLADVSEIVRYTLFSDYVKLDIVRKEVPLSLLIIANAESGKTSAVEQFYPNDGILYANDLTAYGIQHIWLDKMVSGEIKRILIPDLINPVNRKQDTVDTLISFLNSYISWEGVSAIATFAMNFTLKEPVRGSIITTVTPQDFNRMAKNLAAVGFLSRLIFVTYRYSDVAIEAIMNDIAERNDGWSKIKLDFPKQRVDVELSPGMVRRLINPAKLIGKQAGVYGMRALKALSIMAKAKALSECRTSVSVADVNRIIDLATRFIKIPNEVLVKGGSFDQIGELAVVKRSKRDEVV